MERHGGEVDHAGKKDQRQPRQLEGAHQRAEAADPDASYTARLLAKGIDTVCKKVGEEATEVVVAAKGREREQVVYESADLLYHLTVLWRAAGVSLEEVAAELASRRTPGEGGS